MVTSSRSELLLQLIHSLLINDASYQCCYTQPLLEADSGICGNYWISSECSVTQSPWEGILQGRRKRPATLTWGELWFHLGLKALDQTCAMPAGGRCDLSHWRVTVSTNLVFLHIDKNNPQPWLPIPFTELECKDPYREQSFWRIIWKGHDLVIQQKAWGCAGETERRTSLWSLHIACWKACCSMKVF